MTPFFPRGKEGCDRLEWQSCRVTGGDFWERKKIIKSNTVAGSSLVSKQFTAEHGKVFVSVGGGGKMVGSLWIFLQRGS